MENKPTVVDLQKVISEKKAKESERKLDAQASYVILEKCLKQLELNKMKELESLKKDIKKAMNKLVEIGKNG